MDTQPSIRQLPKGTADKIAAGEVVERPFSIVKELVENSVDAQASCITVEIRKGGKEYIRITDNGCGISRDQLTLAFQRYATSKIYDDSDLYAIHTLGFRGEALASIAAVSRTEMLTKPAYQRVGARIVLTGGETEAATDYACEDGTTIVVRDLFFNLPARKKFLRADNTEAALITDYISKMALAYPSVKFRLISNGNILFSTPGKGNIRNTIATVYSPAAAADLIEIPREETGEDTVLYGFISPPSDAISSRRRQIFFVNGRWVKSRIIEQALDEAFRDKLFEGRYPGAYLFLQIPPQQLDVNIHPNKTDVRFFEEDTVKEQIYQKIRRSLLVKDAAPRAAERFLTKENKQAEKKENCMPSENSAAVNTAAEKKQTSPVDAAETEIRYQTFFSNLRADKEKTQQVSFQTSAQEETAACQESPSSEKKTAERLFHFSELEFVGQVFATYLVARDEKTVYFIDQHAAHERVLFEELVRIYNHETPASQLLLVPFLVETGAALKLEAEERLTLLRRIGYCVEEFGPSQLVVKEIPSSMSMEEAEDFIHTILDAEALGRSTTQEKRDFLISKACKAAIKANDRMNPEEAAALFLQLDQCENPFSCPHGRPTFVRMSEYDMERLFKRK